MQISVETTSGLERRMTIGLPAANIDAEVETRLGNAARGVRIDGFRPGKVPMSVVRQRYGAGIRQEVIGDVMRNSFVEAITKEELRPAGAPAVEPTKNVKGQDFEFTATFEVYPEIELAGFDGFKFKKYSSEVTDADVDKMLENLQEQRATYKSVKRKSKKKDQVTVDFVGRVDGEEFAGGKAEGQKVVLGSNQMIPGFEKGIIGMKAGEEQTIDVKFPDDYQAEDLKGKDAQFDIKLIEVGSPVLPEVDEEFIKSFQSSASDLEGFKSDIKGNMEREARQALTGMLKNEIIDKLIEANEVHAPSALVSEEIGRLQQQAVQQYGGEAQMDPSSLPAELFQDQAERRVKVGLIMNEVVSKFELKAEDEAIDKYLTEMASVYQEPQTVIDYYRNNPEQLSQVQAVVVEEAVIEKILSESKVTEKSVGYDEALKLSRA